MTDILACQKAPESKAQHGQGWAALCRTQGPDGRPSPCAVPPASWPAAVGDSTEWLDHKSSLDPVGRLSRCPHPVMGIGGGCCWRGRAVHLYRPLPSPQSRPSHRETRTLSFGLRQCALGSGADMCMWRGVARVRLCVCSGGQAKAALSAGRTFLRPPPGSYIKAGPFLPVLCRACCAASHRLQKRRCGLEDGTRRNHAPIWWRDSGGRAKMAYVAHMGSRRGAKFGGS